MESKTGIYKELLWPHRLDIAFDLIRGDRHIDWENHSKLTILKGLCLLICPPFLVILARIIKADRFLDKLKGIGK